MNSNELNWAFTISLFANTSVALMGIIFAPMVTVRLYRRWHRLLNPARMGMFALATISWYMVLRVGYWSPTMWLSDVGGDDRYHSGWITFRWLSYAPVAILGLLGLTLWMHSLNLFRKRTIAAILALSIAAGLAVAATWQASELGYWFDRQAVIEAHDRFWGYKQDE